MAWRDRVLYPFSERLDRNAIRTGALFDFAEMARMGVTTAVDFFYLHGHGNENDVAVIEAARSVGLRVVLARSMYDWAGAPKRYQDAPEEAGRTARARADPVALGTDGGCTNSRQSVFEEMRMASLLAKATQTDAGTVSSLDVLLAGTARGGEALGMPVGRIAPDHAADLVVIDLDALTVQPSATAEKQIVYAMQPDAIRRVIVGGETIVEDGRLTRVDEAEMVAKVAEVTKDWSLPAPV